MPVIKGSVTNPGKQGGLGTLKPYKSNQRSPNKGKQEEEFNSLNYQSHNIENFTLVSENLSKLTQ